MAFTNTNDYLTGRKPIPTSDGYGVVAARFAIDLTTADLDANDVGAVAVLPAGHVPVALFYDSTQLDTNGTAAIAVSVGVLNAAGTDLSSAEADGGAAWGTGIGTSKTGGQAAVTSLALASVTPTDTDRKIGIKVTTAAATKKAGTVGLTLLYRSV